MDFSPEVVGQIAQHMNDDHAADNLLIVRTLGGQPDASAARMTGADEAGIDFAAAVGGREVPVRLPWSSPIRRREQVRLEVVRMYQEALAAGS